MGTSRTTTERQLKLAKDAVDARSKALEGKGLKADAFSTDPVWRHLDAKFRQVNARLRKITEVESVEADLQKRKEERLAAAAQEKAEPKKSKKPAKAEEKPKKKEGGGKEGGKDKAAKPKKEKAEK